MALSILGGGICGRRRGESRGLFFVKLFCQRRVGMAPITKSKSKITSAYQSNIINEAVKCES
jgi:hypothetical protein